MLEEFEALYEQASIPVLELPPLQLQSVAVLARGMALDRCALAIAGDLAQRHSVAIRVLATSDASNAADLPAGAQREAVATQEACVESASQSDLVIVPANPRAAAPLVDLDRFVEQVRAPILLLQSEVSPSGLFERILHTLTGNFEQRQNFAYSFGLAAERGRVQLLHVIREDEIEDVREALQLTEGITQQLQEEVLEHMRHHGERYLKGVVRAARELPCEVTYQLEVGGVLDRVEKELAHGQHTLLVVGAHEDGRSHVAADVYQLMHQVRDLPVLAL
jgi:hypothetical protein